MPKQGRFYPNLTGQVSPHTEQAIYRDQFWSTLPATPGYGAVGKVVALGDGLDNVSVGDQIFCYNHHMPLSCGSLTGRSSP